MKHSDKSEGVRLLRHVLEKTSKFDEFISAQLDVHICGYLINLRATTLVFLGRCSRKMHVYHYTMVIHMNFILHKIPQPIGYRELTPDGCTDGRTMPKQDPSPIWRAIINTMTYPEHSNSYKEC